MTVRKRERPDEEPDFNAFIEGNEIPPHLVEQLSQLPTATSWTQPMTAMPEPVIDDDEEAAAISQEEAAPTEDEAAEYRLYVLGKAAHIVTRDRNVEYGKPEQSFERIAALWGAYLGTDMLMAHDVAAMMALLKIARIATSPLNEDSWVDLAGYAACGADVTRDLRDNPNIQAE